MDLFITTWFFLLGIFKVSLCQEILGCGGFVKSDTEIDFTQIEIRLYTAEGMLKYQTECAPTNGYYMVPFVEKGNFMLKIETPAGWLFEPMSVQLNVDGVNDDCSKGKDINFVFKGFVVSGQINSVGSKLGPAGISVELFSVAKNSVLQTTSSASGGSFTFEGVHPGQYRVTAKHKSYSFDKDSTVVIVKSGNTKCSDEILISGYNIQGEVSAQSLPVTGVQLLLFAKKPPPKKVTGCSKSLPEGADSMKCPGFPIFVCMVTSDGKYVFHNLPAADYAIMPHHKGERTQYDIEPQVLEISISNDHVNKGTRFLVTGFSLQGRILSAEDGEPVEGAEIFINGKKHDVTDENGYYTVKHKQPAHAKGKASQRTELEIIVKKEDLDFLPTKVEIRPETPFLPIIVAKFFSVCGYVDLVEAPTSDFSATQIAVQILSSDKSVQAQRVNIDKNGLFCFMIGSGEYSLQAIIPKSVEEDGLVLLPRLVKTRVSSRPVKNVAFKQYRTHFKVTLTCIDTCKGVRVELASDRISKRKQEKSITDDKNVTTVQFNNILPGNYLVKVAHDDWCWASQSEKVTVSRDEEKPTASVHFKQSGFVLVCSISHDVEMIIHHAGEAVDTFQLKKGRNRLCLSSLGEYRLEPRSCHRFDIQSPILYHTAHPKPINLHAVAHEAIITVETSKSYMESDIKEEFLSVQIRSSRGKVTNHHLKLVEKMEKTGPLLYRLSYWASDGEKLEIIPSSRLLLFDPPTITATMQAGECSTELARFVGIVGIFLSGQVTPPLINVDITIATAGSTDKVMTLKTGKEGEYRVGPLLPNKDYKVSAAMEDYVFTALQGNEGSFSAKKLSKLHFMISIKDTGMPLPGVLVSISGGSYRSNNLTGGDGSLTLVKLEPGSYYFKAVMKEYEFEPPSQVIEITEGAKTEIKISGKRVAYSVYGVVTSLNGEPETGASVRALARPDSDQCQGLGEEGSSGNDGVFRIRGLRPGCTYDLSVHDKADRFSRVVPEMMTIVAGDDDVHDVRFIAFRPLGGFELSGNVVTSSEYLPHIKMVLYHADEASGTPIHVVSLTKATPFFHFPPLSRDEKEYFLKLECSLSPGMYDYTAPAAGFFTTGSHKHITFHFNPQMKPVEAEMSPTPIFSLPLTLLAIFLAYNYTQVVSLLKQAIQLISKRNEPAEVGRSSRKSKK